MKILSQLALLAMVTMATLAGCKSSRQVADASEATMTDAAVEESSPGSGMEVNDSNQSLLWQISGNGLEEPSYLFGTIHLIGSDDFIFPDAWTNALNQTQHLMLEIDMDDPGMMMKMMKGSMMEDGQSLKDLVSEENYQMIKTFFKDSLNQPIAMFGKMKPMLLTSTMLTKMIKGDPVAYEMVLVEKAKELDMEVTGVETVEDQLSMVDKIPVEDQIDMLMAYVEDFPNERIRFRTMTELYVVQDLQGLYQYIVDSPEMDEAAKDLMLDQRNLNWIPVIEEQAATMPTFFAFGAGHLMGDKGVINLLREAGYTIQPMK